MQSARVGPSQGQSIVHFDAYPVHIPAEFLDWVGRTFPFLILIYVPANCASKMQVADVALNRPLKADYTNGHMRVATARREQMSAGVEAAQVRFETAMSKCAGAVLACGCIPWARQNAHAEGTAEHRLYEVLGR